MLHSASINQHRVFVMPDQPINIKEACLDAAHDIIAEHGLDNLSLREVSRRLHISHQAPYKHFPSKDHLLAAVLSRCFARFAYALDHREKNNDPHFNLLTMGLAYIRFAIEHPLEYKLMFNTSWPQHATSEDMIANSLQGFELLKSAILEIRGNTELQRKRVAFDAMTIWSAMHGYVSIRQSNVIHHMQMSPDMLKEAEQYLFEMIRKSLL